MARSVTIAAGKSNVQLPNGGVYDAGKTVILTDAQFDAIADSLIPGTIIDNGATGEVGDAVVTQAATVAAIATADATDLASAVTLANANKAKINEILTALKGTGKPMASA